MANREEDENMPLLNSETTPSTPNYEGLSHCNASRTAKGEGIFFRRLWGDFHNCAFSLYDNEVIGSSDGLI